MKKVKAQISQAQSVRKKSKAGNSATKKSRAKNSNPKNSKEKYLPREQIFNLKVKKSPAGLGLYADEQIKKGSFIIEYYGPIITQEEANKRGGKYLFEINTKRVVNGAPRYNTARYINHSCRPNAESRITKNKVFIYSIKNIKPGEQLSYDYGKEYFNEHIKPYGCMCSKCKK